MLFNPRGRMERETVTVAVCATSASSLAELAKVLSKAGGWGIVPIHWPNEIAWNSALGANVYVVDSDGLCDELIANLRARTVPMIAIGSLPLVEISPEVWLPTMPTSSLLGSLPGHLLT